MWGRSGISEWVLKAAIRPDAWACDALFVWQFFALLAKSCCSQPSSNICTTVLDLSHLTISDLSSWIAQKLTCLLLWGRNEGRKDGSLLLMKHLCSRFKLFAARCARTYRIIFFALLRCVETPDSNLESGPGSRANLSVYAIIAVDFGLKLCVFKPTQVSWEPFSFWCAWELCFYWGL